MPGPRDRYLGLEIVVLPDTIEVDKSWWPFWRKTRTVSNPIFPRGTNTFSALGKVYMKQSLFEELKS